MIVTIMTSNNWPSNLTQNPPSCNLPEVMLKACQSFERYYLSRHSGRRLTWQLAQGNADVRATFKNRKHDLNVSTFALVILLLFEDLGDGEVLSYKAGFSVVSFHLTAEIYFITLVGNKSCNCITRSRLKAAFTVAGVCKV